MPDPFPIPKTFACPYCDQSGRFGSFNTDHNRAHYSHQIDECKQVGNVLHVILQTRHQFVTQWDGKAWYAADVSFGSSKVIERIKLHDGDRTGWKSCDEVLFGA